MDTDTSTQRLLEGLFFVGTVSTQDVKAGTVSVYREDKEKVTEDLFVLQRGTASTKDFWMPAVGDKVLCIQTPNFGGKGVGEGYVLGSYYNAHDTTPSEASATTRVLNHPGDVVLNVGGTFTVHAGTLDITGGGDVVASGRSLVGHTHTGVHGETSPAH